MASFTNYSSFQTCLSPPQLTFPQCMLFLLLTSFWIVHSWKISALEDVHINLALFIQCVQTQIQLTSINLLF